jgi:hypothetical protein
MCNDTFGSSSQLQLEWRDTAFQAGHDWFLPFFDGRWPQI